MKYFPALIVNILLASSCFGAQNISQKNSVEINLDENGIISNNGFTKNTEITYYETFDHSTFNDLLQKFVSADGNVDYKGLKSNYKTLQSYIELLKTNQPSDNWTKNDKLAYWINAYNALTIDLILKNYPIKSIKDIKDPWDQRLWKLGTTWQNLNDIEHKILRSMNEPRIHFAIVCASISCPKLQNTAFTASKLEDQLTNATKEFLADTTKNELSKEQIKISRIFKWFKKDFETNGSLIDFLNQYSDVKISNSAKKSFKDYDWNLNE
ncbi:DUF547 domain-containing protein [Winogradskyella wichelsiae]|uniref:DUF547 domain-containing protein n=1 Tax=Winogradskyella wichelsiae TaxID=2697007 RepID=UPI003EF5BC2E